MIEASAKAGSATTFATPADELAAMVRKSSLTLLCADRYFDSAGVTLHYVEAGSGEPVILLHSFTGDLDRDFVRTGVFAALVARYHVIAFDLRGHGKSGKPHDPRQYGREMALDAVRLLDHLHLAKSHVVGYSLGGHIAAQLVSLHPERLITATLGGSPGRRHWSDDDDRRVVLEAREMKQGVMRAQILRLWPSGEPPPSEEDIRARAAKYLDGNDPKALAAVRLANREQVVSDAQIAAALVPMLGLVGSNDDYLAQFRELAKALPQLALVVIEGATHGDACARPEFREALLAFLQAQSGDRADGDRTAP
jgi:pimeloyl-ACP methyl ester carboxylesterase